MAIKKEVEHIDCSCLACWIMFFFFLWWERCGQTENSSGLFYTLGYFYDFPSSVDEVRYTYVASILDQ